MEATSESVQALHDFVVARARTQGCNERQAQAVADSVATPGSFIYSKWRHGGWYVSGVRYPSGACGCVSRNYVDNKWRIACDSRRSDLNAPGDFTFASRDAAAHAEHALVREAWIAEMAKGAPQ